MKKRTLLQQALETEVKKRTEQPITDEDMELFCAYLRMEITQSQVRKVKKLPSGAHVYTYLVKCLEKAILEKRVVVKNK